MWMPQIIRRTAAAAARSSSVGSVRVESGSVPPDPAGRSVPVFIGFSFFPGMARAARANNSLQR
jgi:hypothetical protein